VPNDPDASVDRRRTVRAGRRRAPERRAAARAVRRPVLEDLHVVDPLALPERDLSVGAGERAVERERNLLADVEGAVGLDEDVDVRLRKRERLRLRLAGRPESDDRCED
jgi:hypothetical protein